MTELVEQQTPWWEALGEGSETPAALVRVELTLPGVEGSRNEDDVLRRRARFSAGVEYVARAFDAVQPLSWDAGGVTLVIGGCAVERLPERAYLAAREIWERSRIDLDLPVRIGAHVGHAPIDVDAWPMESTDLARCRALCEAAPAATVLLSEDVALALPEAQRSDLAPIGVTSRGLVPAWVFPAVGAHESSPGSLAGDDDPMWARFRAYALGPEVRALRYVGFRLGKREPPMLDVRDVFVVPEVELRPPADRLTGLARGHVDGPRVRGHAARLVEEHERLHQDLAGVKTLGEILSRRHTVVVLGDPGAGKTTLVRWLAVTAACGSFALGSRLGIFERLLPLPVSVGRLAELRRSGASVLDALTRYFEARGIGDAEDIARFLRQTSSSASWLLLLDGLDEVRASERQAVLDWLVRFVGARPGNRVVATSRIVGYGGFAAPGVVEGTLRPFDDAQVTRYVRAFTAAYARWEAGGDDEGRGAAEARQLLAALQASARLASLAQNPFMLSALALVHRAEGRLPRHRVQAYEIFARALCETWADARRLVSGQPEDATIAYEEEALPILGALALSMHRRYPAGVAPEGFVVETLAGALAERQGVSGEQSREAARAFLDRAGREVQILLERGAGDWGFLHLTFQEFFTAAGLHALERFEEEAFSHLFDPRWEEVLRLGVGYLALVQKRPEAARRFVQRVLEYEAPEAERWVTGVLQKQVPLAALLAAEAGDALPEGVKRRVVEMIAAWVGDPPDRERADEVVRETSQYDLGLHISESLGRRLRDGPPPYEHALRALQGLASAEMANDLAVVASRISYDECEGLANVIRRIVLRVDELAVELLRDASSRVRVVAVFMLADGKLEALIAPLLHDEDCGVRLAAARRFWRASYRWSGLFNSEMIAALDAAVMDRSAEVRALVVEALGRVSRHRASEEAVRRLYSVETTLRNRVLIAEALCRMHSRGAFDALCDEDVAVRAEAADYFDRLEPDLAARQLLEMMGDSRAVARAGAAMALQHFVRREDVYSTLLAALADLSAEVRAGAVHGLSLGLGEKAPSVVRRTLCGALRDADWQVREAAIYLVGDKVWKGVFEALCLAMQDTRVELRRAAAYAMGERRDHTREAEAALVSALMDEDQEVRKSAASALSQRTGVAVEMSLLRALADPDVEIRTIVCEAMATRGGPAAVPHLLSALPTTPAARAALWAISERLHQPDPSDAPAS